MFLTDVVVGLQHGDEGKGKVTYNLLQQEKYRKMNSYRSSEGRVMKIPYKGDLTDTVMDYLGGLRSTCTYINAKTIKQMAKCTTFVKVSQQVNNFFGA
jgi:IMP dehydrogenase/GMP reductase